MQPPGAGGHSGHRGGAPGLPPAPAAQRHLPVGSRAAHLPLPARYLEAGPGLHQPPRCGAAVSGAIL
eukprot:3116673-Alexandrium_andersonii.AAC.1